MNYQRIYDQIISRRSNSRLNEYCELHHIIPKSIGGSNDSNNLVYLTAREHFICHLLLVHIHKDTPNYFKMVKAFFMMQTSSNNQQRYITSRKFAMLREQYSLLQSDNVKGNRNPNYGNVWCVEENATSCVNRKLFPKDYIPNGWVSTKEFKLRNRPPTKKGKVVSKQSNSNHKEEKKLKLTKWCELYCSVGFDKFVEITGYKFTKQNLVQQFSKWVPTFIPQNGKPR